MLGDEVLLTDAECIRLLRLDHLGQRESPPGDVEGSFADHGLDSEVEAGLRAFDSLQRLIENGLPTVAFSGPGGGARLFRRSDVMKWIDDQS